MNMKSWKKKGELGVLLSFMMSIFFHSLQQYLLMLRRASNAGLSVQLMLAKQKFVVLIHLSLPLYFQ
jgi:hypothetical protein